jgi:hypothetical protein
VILALTDGDGVKLTFRKNDALALLSPEVLAVESDLFGITKDREVLVGEPNLLGHQLSLIIPVVSYMTVRATKGVDVVTPAFTGIR